MSRWLSLLALIGISLSSRAAFAWETRHFSFEDERYLQRGQERGGAVVIPPNSSTERKAPLVVFLHGTNEKGELHLWVGGGERDLRPVAQRLIGARQSEPFLLALPSQTRDAVAPQTMWSEFDLDAFVTAVASATQGRVEVDRRRVLLVGHSGAGCNPRGGLAPKSWQRARVLPLAIASIDPCLDGEMGKAMSKRPAQVPLYVWWQSGVWPRSAPAFWNALVRDKPRARVDRLLELALKGPDAHDEIVPIALERLLTQLLPPAARAETAS